MVDEEAKVRKLSNTAFRVMSLVMAAEDLLFPRRIERRVASFGVNEGMTVVDYGCGTGRYTTVYSKIVKEKGIVYAVDIHELSIRKVGERIGKEGIRNVKAVLADGYNSGVPEHVADAVTAIDMFFLVPSPTAFLEEVHRITKKDGFLIVDDGHESRTKTKERIGLSSLWQISEETSDHLKCLPV